MTLPPVIDVRDLTKRRGDRMVVDRVSFSVHRGEIVGILGHNGAGKTSAIECVQGLRNPDGGTVSVLGCDPLRERARLGSRIGSQLQASALPERLRVGEALRLFADDDLDMAWVESWGLRPLWDRAFANLSGGQQQRLFVALALINRPEVVFLDELTQGLDPAARREAWSLIRRVGDEGTTVVLVTHFVDEAEALCDRLIVMSDGRVVATGTPEQLIHRYGPGTTVRYTDPYADESSLRSVPGVAAVEVSGREVAVRGSTSMIAHLGGYLVGRRADVEPPSDIRVTHPTLEDALLSVEETK